MLRSEPVEALDASVEGTPCAQAQCDVAAQGFLIVPQFMASENVIGYKKTLTAENPRYRFQGTSDHVFTDRGNEFHRAIAELHNCTPGGHLAQPGVQFSNQGVLLFEECVCRSGSKEIVHRACSFGGWLNIIRWLFAGSPRSECQEERFILPRKVVLPLLFRPPARALLHVFLTTF